MKSVLLILAISLLFSLDVLASGAPPEFPGNGSGPPSGCWPPSTCIPIDTGLIFLLLAGIVYGGKMIYGKSKTLH